MWVSQLFYAHPTFPQERYRLATDMIRSSALGTAVLSKLPEEQHAL
jgi:hypothetical protein